MVAASSSSEERRTVNRALGKWRGSTLSGYLRDGDDQTYLENFRCTKARFEFIVQQLQDSPLDLAPPKVLTSDWRKVRRTQRAREVADPPPRRYKVACALYAMGQGGPIKVLADAASIGESTLRKYLLEQYADACTKRLKPIYMPGTPWSREERTAVQDKFASRRGFRPVSLACDASAVICAASGVSIAAACADITVFDAILNGSRAVTAGSEGAAQYPAQPLAYLLAKLPCAHSTCR